MTPVTRTVKILIMFTHIQTETAHRPQNTSDEYSVSPLRSQGVSHAIRHTQYDTFMQYKANFQPPKMNITPLLLSLYAICRSFAPKANFLSEDMNITLLPLTTYKIQPSFLAKFPQSQFPQAKNVYNTCTNKQLQKIAQNPQTQTNPIQSQFQPKNKPTKPKTNPILLQRNRESSILSDLML